MPSPSHLEAIPLGGLGEFGMNLMVYRWGQDCLVVDTGMMFPGAEHLGVDVVIPDLAFLDICGTIHGVILTHGHEDHIGALPFLLARHDLPVYGTPFTLSLARTRLAEHNLPSTGALRPIPEGPEPLRLGPFTIRALPVAHSIPQSRMLVIETPAGLIVHTADFKLDPHPGWDEGTDLHRLARVGEQGVMAVFSDSTNAERDGFTPSERTVIPGLDRWISSAPHRVLITSFASNVQRMQAVIELAARHGRRVAVVGSSMKTLVDLGVGHGLLRWPPGVRVQPDRAMEIERSRCVFLVTGSQGEPTSALARIAVGRHREVRVDDGDRVIHSARRIPGNEQSIGRMVDHLLRRGAEVITADDAPVHVSGHPSGGELKLLVHLLRPRFLVPIHGEYRQLHAHARRGTEAGLPRERIVLADSGDVIAVAPDSCRVVERVHVGRVFIDANLDKVELEVLRDRRRIAGGGVVVPVVAVDRETGAVGGTPEIVARGFAPDALDESILEEASRVVAASVVAAGPEERADEGLLKARIQTDLKRFLRRRTRRRPLIVPVIVEL